MPQLGYECVMLSRLFALSAAVLCALWAQGVVLCVADEGHTEFELQGMDCCPTEDGDCHDCEDTSSPDPLSPVAVSKPELGACAGILDPRLADFSGLLGIENAPAGPPILASLRSVVLVV